MTEINIDASSLYSVSGSGGTHQSLTFKRPTGICPKHGEVTGDFHVTAYRDGQQTLTSGPLCPECYVEWISANVTHVSPPSPEPKA